MGSFDYITCRHPLPGTPTQEVGKERAFQTKDMSCDFGEYIITEEGKLLHKVVVGRYWAKKKKTIEAPVSDYYGPLLFYDEHLIYRAYFSGGQLKKIVEVKQ